MITNHKNTRWEVIKGQGKSEEPGNTGEAGMSGWAVREGLHEQWAGAGL